MTCDQQTYQERIKGTVSSGLQQKVAFDAAISWREYAGYLETELSKAGHCFVPIASNVLRTYPPIKATRVVYE